MPRNLLSFVVGLILTPVAAWSSAAWSSAAGQGMSTGLIPESAAQRCGLTRAWFARVEMDPSRDSLSHVTQHTNFDKNKSYTVFEVRTADGRRFAFSERDRGHFGRPLGEAGAQEKADAKVQELGKSRVSATWAKRVVPRITLLAQTQRGVLHLFDAETGRTLWSRKVGRSDYPTTAAAANDSYVAAINGMKLYVFDAADGKLLWEKTVGGAPGAGPALSKDYVFAAMSNGRVEAYKLTAENDPAWTYYSSGQVFIQPTVTPASVAWPTTVGHLYVSRANQPSIRFRLETRDAIVAPPAYSASMLFAASRDGNVYAMHETAGGTVWRFTAGAPIAEQPVAIGDAVYVCPEHGGMYRLEQKTGKQVWWAPRAARFVAASESKVYALDSGGRIVILDGKSGSLIDRMAAERLSLVMVNEQNDRIVAASNSGLIQCLHERELPKPLVHVSPDTLDSKPAAKKPVAKPASPDEASPDAAPPATDAGDTKAGVKKGDDMKADELFKKDEGKDAAGEKKDEKGEELFKSDK